jgi:diadenosine tetraphosphate (Ap4A) HIT family hydrolase
MIEDQLSWNNFYEQSTKDKNVKEVKQFNRLIAHSTNFFIISAYGAFTPGYVLIVSKSFIPSFGLVDKENLEELNFMIQISKKVIDQKYNRNSVIFEHGMCACIGGLDRAHLHIMSIANGSSASNLIDAVNETLYERKTGIKYIKYKNYKLENLHDINQLFENKENLKNDDFEIVGGILDIRKIKDLSEKEWPQITFDHINKGGHYVYFKTDSEDSSFLTTHNFQTQFGRQVVYNNEKNLDKNFKDKITNLTKKNDFLEVWKWQNFMFNENILDTMIKTKSGLNDLKVEVEEKFKRFNIQII